jgi:hypothetical protein
MRDVYKITNAHSGCIFDWHVGQRGRGGLAWIARGANRTETEGGSSPACEKNPSWAVHLLMLPLPMNISLQLLQPSDMYSHHWHQGACRPSGLVPLHHSRNVFWVPLVLGLSLLGLSSYCFPLALQCAGAIVQQYRLKSHKPI